MLIVKRRFLCWNAYLLIHRLTANVSFCFPIVCSLTILFGCFGKAAFPSYILNDINRQ